MSLTGCIVRSVMKTMRPKDDVSGRISLPALQTGKIHTIFLYKTVMLFGILIGNIVSDGGI